MIFDVAIVGAGIAGASLAAELAGSMSVLILEAEDHPGYHTTGRSNAFWHATYGGPGIAPLTIASHAALSEGYLSPRGAVTLARAGREAGLDAMRHAYDGTGIAFSLLDQRALAALLPGIRSEWTEGLIEPHCDDIDVAGYHAACLARAKQSGAVLQCRATLESLRRSGGVWTLQTRAGEMQAARVVNAAGAWSDTLAALAGARPLGIQPYRRTIVQIGLKQPIDAHLPMVIDLDGSFYFRPEGEGRVWLSPHDETPSAPCDAAPEELDIAIAIDRFEKVVDWPIARVERSWAGLRSFAPDRLPVYGEAPEAPGFWWCAGQGGFGIQTAPAGAAVCASTILDAPLAGQYAALDAARYAPGRFA